MWESGENVTMPLYTSECVREGVMRGKRWEKGERKSKQRGTFLLNN